MQHAAAMLLAAGAELDAENNGGWTPLQYAIRGGEGYCNPEFVAWLVRAAAALSRGRADAFAAVPRSQLEKGAKRTPQPLTSKLSDVYPHPAALAPHAHGMMQG